MLNRKNQFMVPRLTMGKLGIKINLSLKNTKAAGMENWRKDEQKKFFKTIFVRERELKNLPQFFLLFPVLFPLCFFFLCKLLETEFKKHVSRLWLTPTQWLAWTYLTVDFYSRLGKASRSKSTTRECSMREKDEMYRFSLLAFTLNGAFCKTFGVKSSSRRDSRA